MGENDPKNPYGPNYEELPIDTKIYYKYNRVRQYVHLDDEDTDFLYRSNLKFMGYFLGYFTLSITSGIILKSLIKRSFHEFNLTLS